MFWLICHPKTVSHNLGPKYRSECLSYVTVRIIPTNGEIRLPQIISRSVFFKNTANSTWALFIFNFIHKNTNVLQTFLYNYAMYPGFDFRSFVLSSVRLLVIVPIILLLLLLLLIIIIIISIINQVIIEILALSLAENGVIFRFIQLTKSIHAF